jgi:hypothetical protein
MYHGDNLPEEGMESRRSRGWALRAWRPGPGHRAVGHVGGQGAMLECSSHSANNHNLLPIENLADGIEIEWEPDDSK